MMLFYSELMNYQLEQLNKFDKKKTLCMMSVQQGQYSKKII